MPIRTTSSTANTEAYNLLKHARTGPLGADISKQNFTASTWNPDDKHANVTLSNGNLDADAASGWDSVRAIGGQSSGKYYWEISVDNTQSMLGIATASADLDQYCGQNANSWGYYYNGNKYHNGSPTAFGNSTAGGDIIGFAADLDNGYIYASKNGVWQNSGDPTSGSSGTGAMYDIGTSSTFYPMGSTGYSTAPTLTANFGNSSFTYSVPSGYTAGWNQVE